MPITYVHQKTNCIKEREVNLFIQIYFISCLFLNMVICKLGVSVIYYFKFFIYRFEYSINEEGGLKGGGGRLVDVD